MSEGVVTTAKRERTSSFDEEEEKYTTPPPFRLAFQEITTGSDNEECIYSDWEIVVESDTLDRKFRVHKPVLAHASNYFAVMFQGPFQENQQARSSFQFPDLAVKYFHVLLEQIYDPSEMSKSPELVSVLLYLADYFEVPFAYSSCKNYLRKLNFFHLPQDVNDMMAYYNCYRVLGHKFLEDFIIHSCTRCITPFPMRKKVVDKVDFVLNLKIVEHDKCIKGGQRNEFVNAALAKMENRTDAAMFLRLTDLCYHWTPQDEALYMLEKLKEFPDLQFPCERERIELEKRYIGALQEAFLKLPMAVFDEAKLDERLDESCLKKLLLAVQKKPLASEMPTDHKSTKTVNEDHHGDLITDLQDVRAICSTIRETVYQHKLDCVANGIMPQLTVTSDNPYLSGTYICLDGRHWDMYHSNKRKHQISFSEMQGCWCIFGLSRMDDSWIGRREFDNTATNTQHSLLPPFDGWSGGLGDLSISL